tara:strand:- start:145 stop:273 length:129 start_codon:yes stop_codon:yes gene_type:complete
MNVYHVLMEDNTVEIICADYPEAAERDAEFLTGKTAVICYDV